MLVGKNFHEVAMNAEKDVLVDITPVVRPLQAAGARLGRLARSTADHPSIVIAKMDSTGNELEEIKGAGLPTIKLIKEGHK